MLPFSKLHLRQDKTHSLLCVGLDSDFEKLPAKFRQYPQSQFEFNKWVIDQTAPYVCAFKPNIAFYEARGEQGIHELKLTMEYLQKNYADIFTICDAKRADIGSTNKGYVTAIFDWLGFDAVTINPYLGKEAIQPFLDRKDKVSIILCRTSNSGATEIQDLVVGEKKLWQVIAEKVATEWNENENCMVVAGATYPEELHTIRSIVGKMDLLVPGIGTQGGDLRVTLEKGRNSEGKGLVINSSRAVIFADQPAVEAKQLVEFMAEIKQQ